MIMTVGLLTSYKPLGISQTRPLTEGYDMEQPTKNDGGSKHLRYGLID